MSSGRRSRPALDAIDPGSVSAVAGLAAVQDSDDPVAPAPALAVS